MSGISLHTLKYAPGSRKKKKRIGRGQGSGHGGTSTRGHKGAGARAGAHTRAWFEGGQMPLIRRVPKFGFHSPFKIEYQVINTRTLEELSKSGKITGGNVNAASLYDLGVISKKSLPVKVLGTGDLTAKLTVEAHAFSATAKQKIEAAGGTVQVLGHQK